MEKIQIQILSEDQNGCQWQIVGNGQKLKSGTSKNKEEAIADARKAIKAAQEKK